MAEALVPPDVPIEMIAEEVKESWRLKEVHVEKLMQKVLALTHRLLQSQNRKSKLLLAWVQ